MHFKLHITFIFLFALVLVEEEERKTGMKK